MDVEEQANATDATDAKMSAESDDADADAEAECDIPVSLVLCIAQQLIEASSPLLSFSSRLKQLMNLRLINKDVADMMDAVIWPQFIKLYVREEFHAFGGALSKVPRPDDMLLARMPDYAVLKLHSNMCVDGYGTAQTQMSRIDMVDRILHVAEHRWEWVPIKRELRACLMTGMTLKTAEETYCLGKAIRTLPRIKLISGRIGICKEHVLDAAMEMWGTAEALEAHKEVMQRLAEKRRIAKEFRRGNLERLVLLCGGSSGNSNSNSNSGLYGSDWNLDQLIYLNPSVGGVFRRYANSPSAKNVAAAKEVVKQLVDRRTKHIRSVNALFADAEAEAEADIWRIYRMGQAQAEAEQAILSVHTMKLIYACEQQCGRENGVQPIMIQAMTHFAGRLRAVRQLWTGSATTPITQFPVQSAWILRPTQMFLDGTLVTGITESPISRLKALHAIYVEGVALIREYNAKVQPTHAKYITDASMSRALSTSAAPRSAWDVLSNAMSISHLDLCSTVVKAIFMLGHFTGCGHVQQHLNEVLGSSTCMDREFIINAACDRIVACINQNNQNMP